MLQPATFTASVQTATAATTMASAEPPDKGRSYAARTKSTFSDFEDRNILILKVRKSPSALERQFDDTICEQLCKLIGIRPVTDTIGCQYVQERSEIVIEMWLKDELQASRFSSDIWREICPGFDLVSCHPASSCEVSLLVLDLPLSLKDQVVRDYMEKFGGKVSPQPPQLVRSRTGLWAGQLNGERRYKANFSGQVFPMGTYHQIGGRRVRFIYNGNTHTCGRCHGSPNICPGGGIASRCREKDGLQVNIHQHMRNMETQLHRVSAALVIRDKLEVDQPKHHLVVDNAPSIQPQVATLQPTIQSGEATLPQIPAVGSPPNILPPKPANQPEAAAQQPGELIPTGTTTNSPLPTGTIPWPIPGLTLTKSQKKKEKRRRRRAETAATQESEALDSTTEEKMAKSMRNWLKISKEQKIIDSDSKSNDSSMDDIEGNTISEEKAEFENNILEQTSQSFWEEKPLLEPEPFKSNFARKLSVSTPLSTHNSQRPSSFLGRTPVGTPKRQRSPDLPGSVGGVKALKTA